MFKKPNKYGGFIKVAEGVGLEPTSPKAPVFKTGGLPIILTLRTGSGTNSPILADVRG